jgi:hypothetical protein
MMDYPRTCRFCNGSAHPSRLLKYGVRQYAHFDCYVVHKTIKDRDNLPQWQRQRLDLWLTTKEARDAP